MPHKDNSSRLYCSSAIPFYSLSKGHGFFSPRLQKPGGPTGENFKIGQYVKDKIIITKAINVVRW